MPIIAAPALAAKASAQASNRANTAVRSNLLDINFALHSVTKNQIRTFLRSALIRSLNTAQRESCGPDAHERRISSQAKYHGSVSEHRLPERDRPWVMRTYAGHSDAKRSN